MSALTELMMMRRAAHHSSFPQALAKLQFLLGDQG